MTEKQRGQSEDPNPRRQPRNRQDIGDQSRNAPDGRPLADQQEPDASEGRDRPPSDRGRDPKEPWLGGG